MKLLTTLVALLGMTLLSVALGTQGTAGATGTRPSARPAGAHGTPVVTFTDIGAGLGGLAVGSVAWGDYDNDGDLDFVVTGHPGTGVGVTRIYANHGGGTFTDIGAGLPGVQLSALAWGDYDNDGYLDLVLTGTAASGAVSSLYHNDGAGHFVDTGVSFGLTNGSVAWGDYDNDGDLDLLIAGETGTYPPATRVYRNDGNGTFTDIGAGLQGLYFASVDWGDYDKDGDLDILLAGNVDNTSFARVYRNNGNGTFTDAGVGLTGVYRQGARWGDCNNDGYLDILLSGMMDDSNCSTRVYRNNGDGTFTNMSVSVAGAYLGAVAWGDYDNDGRLDLAVTGRGSLSGTPFTRVYHNDGNWVFTDIGAGLPAVEFSALAWGDHDGDGDLDLLLTGAPFMTRIYRNDGAPANTVPSAPTGLTKTVTQDTLITFQWNASSDAQTPAAGLTYNLRVGTGPGKSDIVSPLSDPQTGQRRIVGMGNVQHRTSWTIRMSRSGTYYWSVQAVDGVFAGSPFGIEGSFVPVLASLASVDAQPDRVRITWYMAEPSGATVYRRTASSGWTRCATPSADGSGFLRFEDSSVAPGSRYEYRLGILRNSEETFAGAVWVEVPISSPAFALEGVRPNPSDGDLRAHFSLPTAAPATLEVLDIHGRRLARLDVTGAGHHIVNLARAARFAPGVYVVRLSQGPHARSVRATVLR
jgi:hypothetical protein